MRPTAACALAALLMAGPAAAADRKAPKLDDRRSLVPVTPTSAVVTPSEPKSLFSRYAGMYAFSLWGHRAPVPTRTSAAPDGIRVGPKWYSRASLAQRPARPGLSGVPRAAGGPIAPDAAEEAPRGSPVDHARGESWQERALDWLQARFDAALAAWRRRRAR